MSQRMPRALGGPSPRPRAAFFLLGAFTVLAPMISVAAEAPSPFQKSAALFLQSCAKCHTVGGGRRVGPDLRGVADRHDKEWIVGFIQNPDAYLETDPVARALLKENSGVRMENAHVTRAQAEGLLEFIKEAANGGSSEAPADIRPSEEPFVNKLRMPVEGAGEFSGAALSLAALLLLAAAALSRTGRKREAKVLVVLAAAAAYWGFGGRRYHLLAGDQQGYEPEQPIAFSHELHAGTLAISCVYCHGGAEISDVAGVPPLSICMNCHKAVRTLSGRSQPSAEIARVVAAWESRTGNAPSPVAWVRVHHLPDYVHFSHRAHVANNIQCQECHGPVQTMSRLRQAAPLSMGWCVQCHRTTPQNAPSHWRRVGGPLDCAACHW